MSLQSLQDSPPSELPQTQDFIILSNVFFKGEFPISSSFRHLKLENRSPKTLKTSDSASFAMQSCVVAAVFQ